MPAATVSATDQLPLDLPDSPEKGTVSSSCRFVDQDGQRFIQINGSTCYEYRLDDRVTESFVWITIRQANQASLPQIANATGLKLRTLQDWRAKFIENNYEGLVPKPKSGRPRIPIQTREKAIRLLQKGQTHAWVTYQLGISQSGLDTIVSEYKAKHGALISEQSLPLGDCEMTEYIIPDVSSDTESVFESISSETGSAEQQSATALPDSEKSPSDIAVDVEVEVEVDKFASQINHSGPRNDPRNRSYDRALAKAGRLYDAPPVFANTVRSEGAGFLMALVLLEQTDVLDIFDKIYGNALDPAFYGLRTTVVTMLMMLAMRIKRPEHLRRYNPVNLGEVQGLDRIMEVKTLRRKLSTLAELNEGISLMEELGKSRIQRNTPTESAGLKNAVYLDGHVKCYYGKFMLGETWSATKNKVVKANTNTWIHLPGQMPLFYLESSFNEGLISAIENDLEKIEAACGEKPVLVFDREGWNTSFLKMLDDAGWKFITYRKGNYANLPRGDFESVDTKIGYRAYSHAPVDQEAVPYNLYQTETQEEGASKRKLIGTIYFREIRILSDDEDHQCAIVTNLTEAEADCITVPATQFARWGNQENVFKYMIAEYGLDDLFEYNRSEGKGTEYRRGEEDIPGEVDHPNPVYTKLTRQISKAIGKRTKLLARFGLEIETKVGSAEDQNLEIEAEELADLIKQIRSRNDGEKLRQLNQEVIDLRTERAKQPLREKVAPAGYKQLRRGVAHIVDSLKMVAYDLDNQLYAMLGRHYANQAKDGRQLIAAAMRTAGSLKVEPGKLVVRLEEQASPNRTAAIDRICEELNALGSVYPGTDLKIEFKTTRN